MSINRLTRQRLYKDEETFNNLLPYVKWDYENMVFLHADASIWSMWQLNPILLTSISDAAGNKAPSSFFVEDGSYFRLKNLDVGYNFRDGFAGLDWVKDVRLSLNVQNVFVITGYSGYDPDVSSTNGGRANRNSGVPGLRDRVNPLLGRGLDARAYPNARTIMFGVQATF